MKVEVSSSHAIDSDAWDKRLSWSNEGSYRQTTIYGSFQEAIGDSCLFLTVVDGGRVAGQLMCLLGSPFRWALERRPLSRFTVRLARRVAPLLYWYEGPVVFDPFPKREICRLLVQRAVTEARVRRCRNIRACPSMYGVRDEDRDIYRTCFENAGFESNSQATFIVDLTKDVDCLWKGLKREARTKVRRGRKDGIEICKLSGCNDMFRKAYEVTCETARRNAKPPMPFSMFVRSIEHHHKAGIEAAFMTMRGHEALSFQRAIVYNDIVRLSSVSYSDYSRQNNLYGNDVMQWHLIEWGHDRRCRWLDFGGAEPSSDDPKMKSIYEFKRKWGGELCKFDVFNLAPGKG